MSRSGSGGDVHGAGEQGHSKRLQARVQGGPCEYMVLDLLSLNDGGGVI